LAQALNWDVTLGLGVNSDFYHINVIRTTLTRNIGTKFPDVLDEISTAFSELIPAKDGEYDVKFFVASPLISALRMDQGHSISNDNGYCM
jgi:hypothetical protein